MLLSLISLTVWACDHFAMQISYSTIKWDKEESIWDCITLVEEDLDIKD